MDKDYRNFLLFIAYIVLFCVLGYMFERIMAQKDKELQVKKLELELKLKEK